MDNQRSADQQNRIENADEELQRGAQVRIRDSGLEFDLAGAGDPDGSSDEVSRKKEESSDRSERFKRPEENDPQGRRSALESGFRAGYVWGTQGQAGSTKPRS